MSADTTVVIAAYRFSIGDELAYTATIVQAVENLFDTECAVKMAYINFINTTRVWFHGNGALGRAKQLAHLLTEDGRVNGTLEYWEQPIIEITHDRVYRLSRKGRRLSSIYEIDPGEVLHNGPHTDNPSHHTV